jgi:hypothetical protein
VPLVLYGEVGTPDSARSIPRRISLARVTTVSFAWVGYTSGLWLSVGGDKGHVPYHTRHDHLEQFHVAVYEGFREDVRDVFGELLGSFERTKVARELVHKQIAYLTGLYSEAQRFEGIDAELDWTRLTRNIQATGFK